MPQGAFRSSPARAPTPLPKRSSFPRPPGRQARRRRCRWCPITTSRRRKVFTATTARSRRRWISRTSSTTCPDARSPISPTTRCCGWHRCPTSSASRTRPETLSAARICCVDHRRTSLSTVVTTPRGWRSCSWAGTASSRLRRMWRRGSCARCARQRLPGTSRRRARSISNCCRCTRSCSSRPIRSR